MNKILGLKKIVYRDSVPYYIEKNTNKLQKVDGLHFSTSFKIYMKDYSMHEHAQLYQYVREFITKAKRKIKKLRRSK